MSEQVKEILEPYTEVDESEITLESSLQGDLGLSSLDVMNLVMVFEDAFGVQIADEDIGQFVTVGDVVKYLEKLL